MCIDVLLAYMFMCHMCDLCLQRSEPRKLELVPPHVLSESNVCSQRAASTLDCWANSPALDIIILFSVLLHYWTGLYHHYWWDSEMPNPKFLLSFIVGVSGNPILMITLQSPANLMTDQRKVPSRKIVKDQHTQKNSLPHSTDTLRLPF